MDRSLLKSAFLWGLFLWFVGYLLGILLFPFVPTSLVGWLITPIGIALTLWVLFAKIKLYHFRTYFLFSVIWTLIAVVFDYFFLVKLFKPADGYYKPDVYLYYLLTFLLPLFAGWYRLQKKQ
ncbi:MAG TPA: hypothetical protein VF828_01360 [Patescibacteria group bacterium]